MIAYLKGTLVESTPLAGIIDVGGVGYAIHYPVTTAEKLPACGQKVFLYTLVVYREDSQTIYAFATREDRDFFKILTEKVSGIGPKIALNIMSRLSLPLLQQAISNGDVVLLSKCQGIGKKTAERLVIELRDHLGKFGSTAAPVAAGSMISESSTEAAPLPSAGNLEVQDAVSALVSLGYKLPDADKAVRKASSKLGENASTEDLIKQAFSL